MGCKWFNGVGCALIGTPFSKRSFPGFKSSLLPPLYLLSFTVSLMVRNAQKCNFKKTPEQYN